MLEIHMDRYLLIIRGQDNRNLTGDYHQMVKEISMPNLVGARTTVIRGRHLSQVKVTSNLHNTLQNGCCSSLGRIHRISPQHRTWEEDFQHLGSSVQNRILLSSRAPTQTHQEDMVDSAQRTTTNLQCSNQLLPTS